MIRHKSRLELNSMLSLTSSTGNPKPEPAARPFDLNSTA